jgi:hypothetical protein
MAGEHSHCPVMMPSGKVLRVSTWRVAKLSSSATWVLGRVLMAGVHSHCPAISSLGTVLPRCCVSTWRRENLSVFGPRGVSCFQMVNPGPEVKWLWRFAGGSTSTLSAGRAKAGLVAACTGLLLK